MNNSYFQLDRNNSTQRWNVVCKRPDVNTLISKLAHYSKGLFLAASFLLGVAAPAQATDVKAKAIINSTELLNFLSGVDPAGMPYLMANLQNGNIKRVAPDDPVWIINSDTGNILYYQGQKNFVGQSASRLTDDKGFRFGQRAVDMAKNSRSTWLRLSMGGQDYAAYCGAKAPFVVCTLVKSR